MKTMEVMWKHIKQEIAKEVVVAKSQLSETLTRE